MPHTKRLFIGLPLSTALVRRIKRERKDWENYPLIVTREENLHVTLVFLGFRDEQELPEISEALEEALFDIPAFEISFRAIDLVPETSHPSMLWLMGNPSIELSKLRHRIEQSLGFQTPPGKSFRPHVTLAQLRKSHWQALTEKPVLTQQLLLTEPVEEVVLFESTLREGKRVYDRLLSIPLS